MKPCKIKEFFPIKFSHLGELTSLSINQYQKNIIKASECVKMSDFLFNREFITFFTVYFLVVP